MLVLQNMSSVLKRYYHSNQITEEELNFLESCWLNSLNKVHYNRFPCMAPDWICEAAKVPKDNYWIICNAAILDRLRPMERGLNRHDQIMSVLRQAGISF